MALPAREKWWNDVVRVDTVKLNDWTHLLWGDRVRVLERDPDTGRVKVSARGTEGWVPAEVLGGEPLLELYLIDVGQGDGILVVTPEGHHLMIDGGHQRSRQQTGKSAADFVDWKFTRDYLDREHRDDPGLSMIRLDAMIVSHADADHYGGLRDLIDLAVEEESEELDASGVTVERFYHPGLCPQHAGSEELGSKRQGLFVELLEDRASAVDGLKPDPQGAIRLRGWWKDFIAAVVAQKTKAGDGTPMERLSHESGFLPGFGDQDDSGVKIRVLAPIMTTSNGTSGLKDLGDEGENKNGHSVALRLDYGKRRFLLTGDLNEMAQENIMAHYGDDFEAQWSADVAKACHHGSHHVSFGFLKGVGALSTVFSSGDANTYDHPRAWVLGAAALAGRVIEDPDKPRLRAPLIYSTEVARSIALKTVEQLRRYAEPQRWGRPRSEPVDTVSGAVTTSHWRAVLDRDSTDAGDQPPLPDTRALSDLIYGLVNVRTDGKRLLFAVRNEGNHSWAFETMEDAEIDTAFRVARRTGSD